MNLGYRAVATICVVILFILSLGIVGNMQDYMLEIDSLKSTIKARDGTMLDIQDTVRMYEEEISDLYDKLEEIGYEF